MVSLRRRRLLGLSSGPPPFLDPRFLYTDDEKVPDEPIQDSKPIVGHPIPSSYVEDPDLDIFDTSAQDTAAQVSLRPSNGFGPGGLKEFNGQDFPARVGQEFKRRKQHRRKHVQHHEPCVMRGVYFKNMKWQAAIKVDKKQIHLGTVSSQKAAAHLYDRAAFMCGREPNFELTAQEKNELAQYKWEDFLAMTRSSITNKKHRRTIGAGYRKSYGSSSMQPSSDLDLEEELEANSVSGSEDGGPETSGAS